MGYLCKFAKLAHVNSNLEECNPSHEPDKGRLPNVLTVVNFPIKRACCQRLTTLFLLIRFVVYNGQNAWANEERLAHEALSFIDKLVDVVQIIRFMHESKYLFVTE